MVEEGVQEICEDVENVVRVQAQLSKQIWLACVVIVRTVVCPVRSLGTLELNMVYFSCTACKCNRNSRRELSAYYMERMGSSLFQPKEKTDFCRA